MKSLGWAFAICATLLFAELASCKKDNNSSTTVVDPSAPAAISNGPYGISYYNAKGTILTNNYLGYTFTFSGSSITVEHNGQKASGTWSQRVEEGKNKIRFSFSSSDPLLTSLNKDWLALSSGGHSLQLRDANTGTEELHFNAR